MWLKSGSLYSGTSFSSWIDEMLAFDLNLSKCPALSTDERMWLDTLTVVGRFWGPPITRRLLTELDCARFLACRVTESTMMAALV